MLDPYRTVVDKLLKSFPDITAQRVFEELRGKGFTGGYTAVSPLPISRLLLGLVAKEADAGR